MNTDRSNPTCPKCGAAIPADAPRALCPRCVLAGAATVKDAALAGGDSSGTDEIPSLARVAAAFPQLEIIELIGRGGMGFVFKARQPHLDRFVALKLLPDQLARDPRFSERFNREGRVLARLTHPNIVSVFDFGRTEHFYFLTMEYVDGVNLRQAMQAGRFSPAEALAVVPRICEALQYAHEQGVLHRDIKPENILLDSKGRVKIADFGIAKLVGEDSASVTLTGTGAALGTPHYMAPEQLERPAEVDHRADIYSLGVVFYEMLTGELPLGRFAPPSAKTPVNSSVDDVVFRALEKDREKRFQSAGEVKTQVEHLTHPNAEPLAAAASSPPVPATRTEDSSAEKSPFAFRAFAGAALVSLSLIKPLTVLVALLAGQGGFTARDLWLTVGSVAFLGVGGTLVGWLALHEIRDSGGRVRGLPLALLATLTWPLLALTGITLGPPMLLLAPAEGSPPVPWLARLLVMILPAGVLTFVVWSVYATARWASRQPPAHERGVLKWIFAGLLACAYGVALVFRGDLPEPVRTQPSPTVHFDSVSQLQPAEPHPWPPAPSGTNTPHSIRFTLTGLDLRRLTDGRWLVLHFQAEPHGETEPVVRIDSSGFQAVTRPSFPPPALPSGSSATLRSIEWRAPEAATEADLLALRDTLTSSVAHHPLIVYEGEQRPLFRFPVGNLGYLAVGLGTAHRTQPLTLAKLCAAPGAVERAQDLKKRAEENLASVRRQVEAGQAARVDWTVAEAELEAADTLLKSALEWPPAAPLSSEVTAAARASNLDRRNEALRHLQAAKQKVQAGLLAPEGRDLLEAELNLALAEAALQENVLAAARVRLEFATRWRHLAEQEHQAGRIPDAELERAQTSEFRTQAALVMLERMR